MLLLTGIVIDLWCWWTGRGPCLGGEMFAGSLVIREWVDVEEMSLARSRF